jgi:hypothetical protein
MHSSSAPLPVVHPTPGIAHGIDHTLKPQRDSMASDDAVLSIHLGGRRLHHALTMRR